MFLHLSVILSTRGLMSLPVSSPTVCPKGCHGLSHDPSWGVWSVLGGGGVVCPLVYPEADTTPSPKCRHPPEADTIWEGPHPQRQTPLPSDTPLEADTPWEGPHPQMQTPLPSGRHPPGGRDPRKEHRTRQEVTSYPQKKHGDQIGSDIKIPQY